MTGIETSVRSAGHRSAMAIQIQANTPTIQAMSTQKPRSTSAALRPFNNLCRNQAPKYPLGIRKGYTR